MKISIGTNIKEGPWGGGNLFAINLRNYLLNKNHDVVTNLFDNDIDLIDRTFGITLSIVFYNIMLIESSSILLFRVWN